MDKMILLEIGNLDSLIPIIFGMLFGPAIIFAIIGLIFSKNNKKKPAKIFYILAVVYMIISLGICGGLVGGI